MWHWENNTTNDPSIELDLEEVKALCKKLGFKLEVGVSISLYHILLKIDSYSRMRGLYKLTMLITHNLC